MSIYNVSVIKLMIIDYSYKGNMETVRYIHAYLACGERLNTGLDMNYDEVKGRSTERHVWRYTRHHEA